MTDPELRQIPATALFYPSLLGFATTTLQQIYTEFPEKAMESEPEGPNSVGSIEYPDDALPQRLNLPSIGSDSAILERVCFSKATYDGSWAADRDNHYGLELFLEVYNDGSPYIADGDAIDSNYVNTYVVVGPIEGPPFIAHLERLEHDEWVEVDPKTILSDQECEDVLTFLKVYPYAPKSIDGTSESSPDDDVLLQ
jgi:hypothetical protein